jgi:folate-binding protein YgfZ
MSTNLLSLITSNIKQLTRLPYSFVSITGLDAEKFLQGQLTCDLASISEQSVQFGTINSPKGRMYGLFKIVRIENGFLIRLEPSTLDTFIANISKYKVFFKCEIKEDVNLFAFAYTPLDGNTKVLPQQLSHLSHIGSELISCTSHKQSLFEIWSHDLNLDKHTTNLSADTWFALESKLGIPELYAATQDRFILQYLNLQTLGAVSFKKGCYTGQEIIARMKFLGKLKKKMYLLASPTKQTSEPGADVYDENGLKKGIIVRSHWSEITGSVSLAILSTSYSESEESLYLTPEKDTPFLVTEINYEI